MKSMYQSNDDSLMKLCPNAADDQKIPKPSYSGHGNWFGLRTEAEETEIKDQESNDQAIEMI